MERARSDMLRLAGIDQRAAMEAGDGSWAVTDLAIKYLSPAKLDDDLLVVSTVEAVRGASVVIAQRILRGAETLTDGRVTAAFLSPKRRPRRQPPGWADRFTAIMNGETIPCYKIRTAHVCTPVTNAPLVCRPLLEKQNKHNSH